VNVQEDDDDDDQCANSTPSVDPIPNGNWHINLTGSKYVSGTLNIAAPNATLNLVLAAQGTVAPAGCVLSTAQVNLSLTVSDGVGLGSIEYVSQKTGATCAASDLQQRTSLLSSLAIQRTSGCGTGFERPDGTWQVTGTRPNDVATLNFLDGSFTGTFMNRTNYSFAGSTSMMFTLLNAIDTLGVSLNASKQ
jgi:hypothetical protein